MEVNGYKIGPGVNLSGADLSESKRLSLTPKCVNLSRANLSGANLDGANLSRANLSGAILYPKIISVATDGSANTFQTTLRGANLSGANLHKANLSGAILTGATMPDGTVHP